jgi:hypothetical protein
MAINNVDDLRNFLSNQLERVSTGEITAATANASANLAGKIISSVKIELDYNRLVGATPSIGFLKGLGNNLKKISNGSETDESK